MDSVKIICTIGLLIGLSIDRLVFRAPPADAADYHLSVQAEAAKLPFHMGSWMGTDLPVPPGAVKLLKPNVIVSRRFEDLRSPQKFSFLLVQCTDARDILGHYPPVCYVAQGWTKSSVKPIDWLVDDLKITGTEYTFATKRHDQPSSLIVYNFIVLPDGQICRGMDEAEEAAQDMRRKFHGAAQVQFIFDSSTTRAERDEVLELTVRSSRSLIETIRSGVVR